MRSVRMPESRATSVFPPTANMWYPGRVRVRSTTPAAATSSMTIVETGTGPTRVYPNIWKDDGTSPAGPLNCVSR